MPFYLGGTEASPEALELLKQNFDSLGLTAAELSGDALVAVSGKTDAAVLQSASSAQGGMGLVGAKGGGNLYHAMYGHRHLFQYLTQAQITAIQQDNYTGWTQTQLTTLRTTIQNALNGAVGRRFYMPSTGYLRLNGPLLIPSRVYVECPLGSHGAYKPLVDSADNNAIMGAFVVYPDLSIDWKTTWPLRGLIETDNYSWVAGPGKPAKPDYWSWAAIEGITMRAHEDAANYAAYPERVPDYGMVNWCPSDESKVMRCVARNFGRSGFFTGGTQATGTYQECSSWYSGYQQNTVFGDTVTRAASAFASAVTVYTPVHMGSSFVTNQIVLECATAAPLDTLAVNDVLTIDVGGGTTINVTVSALATATNTITQRTRIAGTDSTTRYFRTITLTANLTQRLNGRVRHWGFANGNHPDRNFAPGIISGDGGQASGGQFRALFLGGDFNRDALIGFDGAHYGGIIDLKAENHPAAVEITGNAIGGGRGRISLMGRRVEHGTTATTEDYGMIRITGVCRPSVVWDNVAALNHVNILEDYTPLAVGNGGATGADGKPLAFLPRGKNVVTLAENGGHYGRWGLDGSDFSLLGSTVCTDLAVAGTGGITLGNNQSNSLNYSMRLEARYSTSKTYRWLIRQNNSPLEIMTIDNINASGTNGMQWFVWNDTANGMQASLQMDKASVRFNMTALPMAFNGATPIAKPTVTGAKGSNAALGSLITALVNLGLITDTTTT